MRKEELVARVLTAHATLIAEDDLSPRNPKINTVLSALVQAIIEGCPPNDVKDVLQDPTVRAVRHDLLRKLAIAECEMERSWGAAFCSRSSLGIDDFSDFVYWDCYRHLVEGELHQLALCGRVGPGQEIAFVGAGPLPLSAFIMRVRTGMKVTCIDIDPRACGLARELCRKVGFCDIAVVCADGGDYDFTNHSVAFIASLVADKVKVAGRIREKCPHALIALRSVEGLCTLLYEAVDEEELRALGCQLVGRTAHNPQIINTTLFYEASPVGREDGYGSPLSCSSGAAPGLSI
jgi:nicotianamine synthase-like protein